VVGNLTLAMATTHLVAAIALFGGVCIGLLVVGSLVCGLLAIARLEPQLDPRVNGVHESGPPSTATSRGPWCHRSSDRWRPALRPGRVHMAISQMMIAMTTSAARPCFQ
jgi:hypothetical protein